MPAPSGDSLTTLQRYADRIRHDAIALLAAADELDDEGDLEVPGVDREDPRSPSPSPSDRPNELSTAVSRRP